MRAAVFSSLEAMGKSFDGVAFADIFAGTGSYGLEAISRGARTGCFVEKHRPNCNALSLTLSAMKSAMGNVLQDITVRCADAFRADIAAGDIIFVDPPYEMMREKTDIIFNLVCRHMEAANGGAIAVVEIPSDLQVPELNSPILLRTVGKRRGYGSPLALIFGK
jgi:16S rRNA (guanine966-N2)-methyltransferase